MFNMKANTVAPKHMSIYQEPLRGAYSNKLASVINCLKAILDINPQKVQMVPVVICTYIL